MRRPSPFILPSAASIPLNPRASAACPSRLPRDVPPLGPDGRPAVRWTDPRVADAYAQRDDDAERRLVWPLLADAVLPAEPRRVSGRPDGTVLELGCGLGGLAQRLADQHWLRVYAVDISPTMHRLGAARFRDAWVLRTLPDPHGRLPQRRAQCTAAIIQRILLHLVHPCVIVGLLTEARRVLRPGAPLAIVESDTGSTREPDALTYEGTRPEGEAYVEHYLLRDGTTLPTPAWRHSPGTLAACLSDSGFTLEAIQPIRLSEPDNAPGSPSRALLLYRARAV